MSKKHDKIVMQTIWIIALVAIIWAADHFRFTEIISDVEKYLVGLGYIGPLFFILLMAIAIIIVPVPSAPLTIASGFLYGPVLGTLYSIIGAVIGATIAFLIARGIGKKWIYKTFKKDFVFCHRCTKKYMTWMVFFLRLIPFVQFDIVSYGAGLTAIPLRNFIFATTIGMIPATFAEVLVGATLTFTTAGLAISLMFMGLIVVAPAIIKRTNIFNLKKYLYHPPHLDKPHTERGH